jgi:hypothetical protein
VRVVAALVRVELDIEPDSEVPAIILPAIASADDHCFTARAIAIEAARLQECAKRDGTFAWEVRRRG